MKKAPGPALMAPRHQFVRGRAPVPGVSGAGIFVSPSSVMAGHTSPEPVLIERSG